MQCKLKLGVCLLVILTTHFSSYAQTARYLVHSGDLMKEGIEHHDKAEYKEAIRCYQQIPESDTNFCWAMYELSLSALLDSQQQLAISSARKGLEEYSEHEMNLLLQLGSVYDDFGKYDSAAYYLDLCRTKYPNSFLPIHAKGINFYLRKKYDSAFICFREVILMNPYAFNSHYFLGMIAMESGYPVQAMMAFCTSLIISPSGGRSSAAIQHIYRLANLSDSVLSKMDNRKEIKFLSEDYSGIESYFKAKIAFDKKYKVQTKVDDNIFRQLNLICEKLPSSSSNTDPFYQQYYGRLFKNIYEEGHFNGTAVMIISGVNNDAVKKLVNDERKDRDKAAQFINERFGEIGYHRSTQTPVDYTTPGYYFANSNIVAKGVFQDKGMKNKQGEWIFYYDNGQVKSIQHFKDDKANGKHQSFNRNGNLSYEADMKDNKLNGPTSTYYENGCLKFTGRYQDDILEGEITRYYSNGNIKEKETYAKDKLQGPTSVYYEGGGVHYEGNNINSILEGKLKEYYGNDKLRTEVTMVKGKSQGNSTTYYADGKLYEQGELKDGEKEGLFTTYFPSGKILAKENYRKGKLNGNSIYYFENGVERINSSYDNGDKEGSYIEKNEEGKLVEVAEFKRNHYKNIKFYDVRTGKQIYDNAIDSKEKNTIKVYNETGILLKEIVCNRDGVYSGIYKEFFYDGKLKEECEYKQGMLQGHLTSYHPNGKVHKEIDYKDDHMEGMYKDYFTNGQLYMEGQMEAGVKQGYWYTYNSDSVLSEKEYFVDGELHGKNYYYHVTGKLKNINYYDHGFKKRIVEYDTTGKIIQDISFKTGETVTVTQHDILGSISNENKWRNNSFVDNEKWYFAKNRISSTAERKHETLDSTYIQYYLNGLKHVVGQYCNGDKHGTWTTYDRLGDKESIEHYYDGNLNGLDTFYSNYQTVEIIIPQKNNERHGWLEKYAPNGDLAYKFHYIHGLLVGYTYLKPDGTQAPEIYLENGNKPDLIKTYYKNGKLSCELEYMNGDYHGKRMIYYPDGKVWLSTNYQYGEVEGEDKEYFMNGQLQHSFKSVNGDLEGHYLRYQENGKPVSDENYSKGYLHGPAKYYKKDGSLEEEVKYFWGRIISTK